LVKHYAESINQTPEARRLGKRLEEVGKWTVKYESFDGYKSVDISIPYAKVDIES